MLFALAFLPMFGIGGLTGLPLGLAASDVALHDTYYVVGHFHYLVAPGPCSRSSPASITGFRRSPAGRSTSGSACALLAIVLRHEHHLPADVRVGLRGVNRRLYDAGLQYALAQGTGAGTCT